MSYAPVAALLKGLQVMETVNRLEPARLTDIQEATGLPKASVLRLLETLRHGGYLAVAQDSREYLVTARALALSNGYQPDEVLLAAGRPVMQKLRAETGWPSDLALYQGGKMVIADTSRQPGMLSVNRTIGSRVSVMRTSIGRAFLAFCSDAQRAQILDELVANGDTDECAAGDDAWVAMMVTRTRERGYAISNQEYMPTIRAAAVAVMRGSEVACTFNVIVLAQAVSLGELEDRYVPQLLTAKQKMEATLGGESPLSGVDRNIEHDTTMKEISHERGGA